MLRQHAALYVRLVVKLGLPKKVDDRPGGAGFWICSAKHHAFQPGLQHGTAAHGTGLKRDKQRAAFEPVVAQHVRCSAQRDNFGMGGWVVLAQRCVAARSDDLPVFNHHRADWHFTMVEGFTGLRQRELHKIRIGHMLYLK